jgi:hypothetical protein
MTHLSDSTHPDDPALAAIAARKATLATATSGGPKDEDVLDALSDADAHAIRTMLRTPPTTLAGVQALLRYVIACEDGGDDILNTYVDDDGTIGGEILLKTLLTALEHL